MVALPLPREPWAPHAEIVCPKKNRTGERLPAAVSVHVFLVGAPVVARHGAFAGDMRVDIAISNLLRGRAPCCRS